jgi:hypothetical protein
MANYQRISGRRWARASRWEDWGREDVFSHEEEPIEGSWVTLKGGPQNEDYMSADLVLRAIQALQAHGCQVSGLEVVMTSNFEGGRPAPMRRPNKYLVDFMDSPDQLRGVREVDDLAILVARIVTTEHILYLQLLQDDWLLVRALTINMYTPHSYEFQSSLDNDFFLCDGMAGFQEVARELRASDH